MSRFRLPAIRLPNLPGLRDHGPAKSPVDVGHNRLIIGGALFALAFAGIAARLVEVAVIGDMAEPRVARATKAIPNERADILDRNGVLLATSLATSSVFADPRKVTDPAGAARALVKVLPDLNEETIRNRLASEKSFVYIRRNLTPRQQYEVNRLGIPGLGFQREDKRIYPQGNVVSHVLGFSDVDNQGLAGVEKGLNDTLRGAEDPVELAIDVRVQHIMRQELADQIQRFNAIGGMGIVLDVRTGEVIAMVSLPDFDPNEPGTAPDDARFNRATLGVYEMGSTMKIFNTAMALEAGTTSMTGGYDATNPIQIARFTIHDEKTNPHRYLTVPEIFKYSSNVGSVKMAMDVGVAGQRAFLGRLGILAPPRLELPEVGHPRIPMPWRPINMMTIAFGHGLSLSAMQLAAATGSIVNGGIYLPPTLLKRSHDAPAQGAQVISTKTSDSMRRLMRLVVEEGTGRKAAAPGYLLGGKTGTAEKIDQKGRYRDKANLQTFVGAFPITDPRYVILATLDEAKGNKETYGWATAGWVVAPAVSRIIARIAPLLGLPPVDENSPEIRRMVDVNLAAGGPRLASR